MLKNYLKSILRNFKKSLLFSIINIFSLAVGIAACIAIYIFIQDESSFDKFHAKHKVVYRLDEVQTFGGTKPQNVALSMPGMGPALISDFPEITNYTRYYSRGEMLYRNGEKDFIVSENVFVDSTFFKIFDFKLLSGDVETALNEPFSVILTKETADKLFSKDETPIGSTVIVDGDPAEVTGILENVPENSHLQFDVLISMSTITSTNPEFNNRWGSNFLNTYLHIPEASNVEVLESKFDDFMIRHMENPDITDYYKLYLQRLDQVHLTSMDVEHDYNNYRKFNGEYLGLFSIIGLFILLIAGINFMNLSISRSGGRWKEIGVRKSIGAVKSQLFIQFILESILLAIIGCGFALLIDMIFIPYLSTQIERPLSFIGFLSDPINIIVLIGGSIVLGVLTGLYPSIYMSSFKVVNILKGSNSGSKKSFLSDSLVVIQFGLAIAMIVSTLIVLRQINFMQNTDIGFDKEQIVLLKMNDEANENYKVIKDELKNISKVMGVTASGQRIGNNFHQWGFKVKSDTGVYSMTPSNVLVDYDYLEVYGIKLVSGRSFSKEHATDDGLAFIINEALAKTLPFDDPIGKEVGHGFYPDDSLGSIIGVTTDFNFNSLHHKVNTLSMVIHEDWNYDEMSIKIDGTDTQAALADIEKVWNKHVTNWPFEYSFLDEHFEGLYRSEKQMGSIVTIMAVLAIVIACMGLFGLAAITTSKRVKEIGIRKVLGASMVNISFTLSYSFTKLIIISIILASPLTYFLLDSWLNSFAFRIDIGLSVFFVGSILSLMIAFIVIGYHIIKAALENPVNSLRSE